MKPKCYSVVIKCCRFWHWGTFDRRSEAYREARSIKRHHNALVAIKAYGSHAPVVLLNGTAVRS